MLLGAQAVAEQRHRCSLRPLLRKGDRERVHRDRADHGAANAVDDDLGPRQVAPEAVRVADRHEPDPGRLRRDEAAPVARALARVEQLHLGELGPPREDRAKPVVCRIAPERREAVEREATAGGRETRLRKRNRSSAVRDVRLETGVRRDHLAKARDLHPRESRILRRGRQMAHQPDGARGKLGTFPKAVAAHTGVELDVERDPVRERRLRDRELEPGVADRSHLLLGVGAEDEDPGAP